MAKIKGIDIVNLRKLFQKKTPAEEKLFLSRLTDEEQTLYLMTLTTSWNPVESQDAIYMQAGDFLFPQNSKRYILLGKAVAEISYTGIYKLFLKIISPEVMAQRWAKLWRLHHDTGKPSYTMVDKQHAQLFVKEYPGLPSTTRQLITGHISKFMELGGLKQFGIRLLEDNPNHWCWDIVWE